jgi:hypothetical protein
MLTIKGIVESDVPPDTNTKPLVLSCHLFKLPANIATYCILVSIWLYVVKFYGTLS